MPGYRKESFRRLVHKKTFYLSLLVALIIILLAGSLVILAFERRTNPGVRTYGDSVWMLVVTMTTVGYGDKVPITPGGKVTDMVCMVAGIGLLTTFITAHAAARVDTAKRRKKGLDKKTALSDHYVVCGWNNRGEYVIERLLLESGQETIPIAVLCDLEANPFEDDAVFFYRGSPVSENDLRRVNAEKARAIVVLADDSGGGKPGDIDARTILSAMTIKSLNERAKITAEVLEPENASHLQRNGVQEILNYDLVAGNLLAQSAVRHGLIELIPALTTRESSSRIYSIPVENEMIGKSYGDVVAELKEARGYNVLALNRAGNTQMCELDCRISDGDFLIVVSETKPPSAVS